MFFCALHLLCMQLHQEYQWVRMVGAYRNRVKGRRSVDFWLVTCITWHVNARLSLIHAFLHGTTARTRDNRHCCCVASIGKLRPAGSNGAVACVMLCTCTCTQHSGGLYLCVLVVNSRWPSPSFVRTKRFVVVCICAPLSCSSDALPSSSVQLFFGGLCFVWLVCVLPCRNRCPSLPFPPLPRPSVRKTDNGRRERGSPGPVSAGVSPPGTRGPISLPLPGAGPGVGLLLDGENPRRAKEGGGEGEGGRRMYMNSCSIRR